MQPNLDRWACKFLKLVARDGIEPPTPAFSGLRSTKSNIRFPRGTSTYDRCSYRRGTGRTPIPWVINPKVDFDSHSTPITRFRGFPKALSSATRALLLTT